MNAQGLRVAVLHDPVSPDGGPDAQDTLAQVEAVSAALTSCGYEPVPVRFFPELHDLHGKLESIRAQAVFNLVEAVDGSARLLHIAPAFLEHLGVPYTGAGPAAMLLSTDKLLAKAQLTARGIATPAWRVWPPARDSENISPGAYIVKSVHEHASTGLDAASVAHIENAAQLDAAIAAKAAASGGAWFAEQYIDGREFNVSLLETPKGLDGTTRCGKEYVVVPPPAEILFQGYAAGRPRIVDYSAKWEAESIAYANTPRSFDLGPDADALTARLAAAALETWRAFGLRGYARVDFRLDAQGVAYVIDVNANPCLALDAGFAAALAAAKIPYAVAVGGVLDLALGYKGGATVAHDPTRSGLP